MGDNNLIRPDKSSEYISSTEQSTPTAPPQPAMSGNIFLPPKKNHRKKIIIVIAILAVLLASAISFFVFANKKPSNQKVSPISGGSLVSNIDSIDDLENLSEEDQRAFCTELLSYEAEGPEVKALHERVGLSGDLYENIYLGCSVGAQGDEYTEKDTSGENDEYYRRDAQEHKNIAKTLTFDLYDTTFATDDLMLSKRVALDIEGEAKNILMTYATLVNGGFNPYSSDELIEIRIFDIRDFHNLTVNCGPTLMRTEYVDQYNKDKCSRISKTFLGQPIYKSDERSYYSVTVDNTRINVQARSEREALNVIAGMKKVSLAQLDFFIKN